MGESTSLEKVAFVSCRSPYLDDSKIYTPMAGLYLKSYVEKNSRSKIFLLDDNYDDEGKVFDDYDAVAISVMTPQRAEASRIARSIKKRNPDKTVIVGGPHIKHYETEALFNNDFDYIVPLDGEKPLTSIVKGELLPGTYNHSMSREEIMTAPRPDRTSDNAVQVIKNYHYELKDRKATTMMTSRGCPMACTFCEDAKTQSRWSGLENLALEMDDIKGLGFGGVYLFDDLFAIAMPKVEPIVKELSSRDLIYRCNGQANFFTKWGEEFAKLLSSTGCVEIAFGHESGSQEILDAVDKRTSVKQNYDSVKFAKKHGIKVKSFLMLGLPGETIRTIQETERFIKDSGIDDFQLAIYYPYKGTAIRRSMDDGKLDLKIHFEGEGLGAYGQIGGRTEAVVRTDELSSDRLLRERDRIVNTYKPRSHERKWGDKFFEGGKNV